jgi:hypothetical protein
MEKIQCAQAIGCKYGASDAPNAFAGETDEEETGG